MAEILVPVYDSASARCPSPTDLIPLLEACGFTAGSSGTPVRIVGIDLRPTGNPNEFTVEIGWIDSDNAAQTTTDLSPVVIGSNLQAVTLPISATPQDDADVAAVGLPSGSVICMGDFEDALCDQWTWYVVDGAAKLINYVPPQFEARGEFIGPQQSTLIRMEDVPNANTEMTETSVTFTIPNPTCRTLRAHVYFTEHVIMRQENVGAFLVYGRIFSGAGLAGHTLHHVSGARLNVLDYIDETPWQVVGLNVPPGGFALTARIYINNIDGAIGEVERLLIAGGWHIGAS